MELVRIRAGTLRTGPGFGAMEPRRHASAELNREGTVLKTGDGPHAGSEGKKEIKELDFWLEQLGRGKPQMGEERAYTLLKDRAVPSRDNHITLAMA